MDGAVKTAVWRMIFRSTTCVPAAGWGMTRNKISLRYVLAVTEPDMFIAKHHRANQEDALPCSWDFSRRSAHSHVA